MSHLRVLPFFVAVGSALLTLALAPPAMFAQASGVLSEPAAQIVDSIDDSQVLTLTGNTHPLARAEFDRGPVSADLHMGDLVLVLRRSPELQAAFDKFVAAEYDPASPAYHQWLTPEEVGEKFGPVPSDIAAVSNWLSDHGFGIDEVSKDRLSIRFSGLAAQVESTFHAKIHNLEITRGKLAGERHISNMADPQIPAALATVVAGVKALHDFFPRPLHRLGGQVIRDQQSGGWRRISKTIPGFEASRPSLPSRPRPQFGTTDSYGDVVEDVAPYDFATIYNVLPLWQASTSVDGTGQKIAIAGTSNINLADVAAFRSAFGLPAKAPSVVITNNDPGACPDFADSCSGDLVENTLDVEWSGAVAKGASIVLVTSSAPTPTSDALYLSESYIVQNKTATIMNVSYGECELVLGNAGNIEYNNLWQTAASEGIAVFVASGDSGSPACDQGFDAVDGVPYAAQFGLSVSGITSTPYNTSVGGTDFNWGATAAPYWNLGNATTKASALGYIPEVPWNSTCANPLVLPALQSDASYIGVSGVVDAESACNFVIESGKYIEQNFGVDLYGLVDTIGGGGGVSNCTTSDGGSPLSCSGGYAKPSWQAGVKGIPADKLRDVPDVSFFASNGFLGSSYLICVSGGGNACSYSAASEPIAQEVGGTSVASPAMAGVMALINQSVGSSQGNPNAMLYSLAAKQTYASCSAETVKTSSSCVFNDIDTGTNAMACVNGSPECLVIYSGDPAGILRGYGAVVGYDQATGLGSLNVANVVKNWPGGSTAPVVSLSPTSLTFSSTTVGSSSATQKITLTNTGKAALSLSGTGLGISITGTNASSFSQTNTCGTSVAAAASCAISVTFKPTAAGALTAAVSIGDNAYGSPQTVALSGPGTTAAPTATLSAQSLSFGSTAIGATNTAPAIKLTNSGTAPLTITGITFTGTNATSFSQTDTCGTSVAAGAFCSITITFKPTQSGSLTAALSVADNAAGLPQTLALSGTATGASPVVSLSPPSLTFASTAIGVAAATQKVTLTNTGNAALSLSGAGLGISITGVNVTSYTQTNTCGKSVAASASCIITVTFKPAASGTLTASVNVADNASGSPQKVALHGTGAGADAVASLSAASLTFGPTAVGVPAATQKITLSNTGGTALSLNGTGQGILLGGTNKSSFSQTNTCGTSVAAGSSCSITVTFTPAAVGALTASISITDNATGSPQKVSLSGTGALPTATLSPTALTFASTTIGTAAVTQKVTLTNTGSVPLNLNGTGHGVTISGTNITSFSQTNTCGTSVAAGASCTVTVTFKPAASGALTAFVHVADNASNSPQKTTLAGTGAAATAALSPASLTYAATKSGTAAPSQVVTLTNKGKTALSLNGTGLGVSISGPNATSFSQTNTCGSSLAAGASCTITVTFKPLAPGGKSAVLNVAENGAPSHFAVTLSGAGQ